MELGRTKREWDNHYQGLDVEEEHSIVQWFQHICQGGTSKDLPDWTMARFVESEEVN
jgi:hypothetical protein